MTVKSYIVIGSGVFGSSTALELVKAGHQVTVLERSADGYHSPDAASNDLNKIIRADYSDEHYRDLAKETISIWRQSPLLSSFYHETGVVLWSATDASSSSLHQDYVRDGVSRAIGKEAESSTLEFPRQGQELPSPAYVITTEEELLRCFPSPLRSKMDHLAKQLEAGTLQAYCNPRGGWGEADRATRVVLDEAKRLGAKVLGESQVVELLFDDEKQPSTVIGVKTSNGQVYHTKGHGHVIVCTGAWASGLLQDLIPEHLQPIRIPTRPSGQCVVTLQLNEEQRKIQARAPVMFNFTNGFYCFEPDQDGVMKIAVHENGYQHPKPSKSTSTPISFPSFGSGEKGSNKQESNDDDDVLSPQISSESVPADKLSDMLSQLAIVYPHLVDAPVLYTRICFYSESDDENWIIDHFPGLQGLLIASGDSGHGFKFLPIIGQLICARLGLPSIKPLTPYQNNIFSFDHHFSQQAIKQSEAARHRGLL